MYRLCNTHFLWTPDGSTSDEQRQALSNMFELLENEKEFVLCGDFNAPRGREIFSTLAQKFKDNVPPEYTSSLDPVLHRAAPLHLMVDGLFSTPGYNVTGVKMVGGVSDHCALVGHISRAI